MAEGISGLANQGDRCQPRAFQQPPCPRSRPPMNSIAQITNNLRQYYSICQKLLAVVEREAVALRSPGVSSIPPEFHRSRRELFPQLEQSIAGLKLHRTTWQQLPPAERALHPEVTSLLRLTQ